MDKRGTSKIQATRLAIGLVWLFHLSGLLGILLGYASWFIPKTPINLLVSGLLFIWVFPLRGAKRISLFLAFALAGLAAEWIGVHTGWLFGDYTYGENLGPKVFRVPLLIGLNWALLGMICGSVATRLLSHRFARILLGALLMTGLDLAMEPVAPVFDFWSFQPGDAPLKNYICWFGVSVIFQWAYQRLEVRGNTLFSSNLLGAQLVFFTTLSLYTLLGG